VLITTVQKSVGGEDVVTRLNPAMIGNGSQAPSNPGSVGVLNVKFPQPEPGVTEVTCSVPLPEFVIVSVCVGAGTAGEPGSLPDGGTAAVATNGWKPPAGLTARIGPAGFTRIAFASVSVHPV